MSVGGIGGRESTDKDIREGAEMSQPSLLRLVIQLNRKLEKVSLKEARVGLGSSLSCK